jgi:hypothetical protein
MRILIVTFVAILSLVVPRGTECSFYGKAASSRGEPQQRRYEGSSLAYHEGAFADVGESGAVVRPSPECWKSAMTAFYLNTTPLSDDDAKVFCQHMHEDHQKVLALMISQCHLNDLGKALMEDPVVLQDCLQRAATSRDVLLACLKRLTDAGVTAYTHYVAYVQQFCTRLTQELAVQLQVDAHRVMAQRYERLSNESLQQLESIHAWQSTFLDTFSRSFERELQQQLHVHLQDTLQHQFDQVIQRQAVQQARMVEDLMMQLRERQDEQEERQDMWLSHKVDLVQRYLEQLERQHEKLQDQQERIDTLSETIAAVVHDVLPLAGIHSVIGAVTRGYAWVSLSLQTIAGLVFVRFLTRPKRFHAVRSYLVAILMLETAAEAGLFASAQYGWISGNSRPNYVAQLRAWILALDCFLYCFGFVTSFYRAPEDGTDHPSLSTLKLELEQLRQQQNQLVTNLNPESNWVATDHIVPAQRPGRLSPVPVRVTQAMAHQAPDAYTQPVWSQHYGSTASRYLKPRVATQFLPYNSRTSVEPNGVAFDPRSTPESGFYRGYGAYSPFTSLPPAYLQPRPPMPIPMSHAPDHRHWLPVYPPSPAPHPSDHFPSSSLNRPPPYSPPGRVDKVSPSKYEATAATHPTPPVPGEQIATATASEHPPGPPLDNHETRKKRLREDYEGSESDRAEKKPRIASDHRGTDV